MNHAEEVGQILLKTSSNTSVVFQLKKEVFHEMPVLIQALVIRSGLSGIPAAGNDWNTAPVSDRVNKFLAVISLICEHITVLQVERGDQISGRRVITDLSARQINFDGVTKGIDYGMDLRGISTSRTTNSLFFVPPFPPEPCWWTRTYDPSIIYSSLSWSFDSSKKIFSQMPRFVHLEYRLYTLFQDPNRSGKSRQGAPVFRIQIIALIIIRFSLAGRPFPPECSGGTKSLIMSHCSSDISCRLIMTLSMPDLLVLLVSVILSMFYNLQTPSKQEQVAVHIADGYFRVSGKPLAAFTSIGPGALNTAIGIGNIRIQAERHMAGGMFRFRQREKKSAKLIFRQNKVKRYK